MKRLPRCTTQWERGLWDGPDLNVVLERTTGVLLFSESPGKIAEISEKVIAQIRGAASAQGDANRQSPVRATRDARAADLVRDLCGQQIVSVTAQSQIMRGDPVFELSTGERLEIFSDHPTDPWVFGLPGVTYVGSPSDPRYSV